MARYEFKLPDIGEGVAEGEIVVWCVKAGDVVKEDQAVVEVMTDKATVTITAPRAGTVVETRGAVGEVIPVQSVLVVFELPDSVPLLRANGAPSPAEASAEASAEPSAKPASGPPPRSEQSPEPSATYFSEKPLATPATRRLAREQGVDLRSVPPSGEQGRVTHDDVVSYATRAGAKLLPSVLAHRNGTAVHPDAQAGTGLLSPALEARVPFAGLRRRIGQKMARSKATAAHFTFVEECDATALKSLRNRLKEDAAAADAKLTFLPFVVKAVVAALRRHPILNSSLDEATQEIVYRKAYNIGVATATEAGLVVPVVKDADRKSLLEVARDVERLAADARSGTIRRDDLQGGTFTVTSLGERSGLFATPIINHPEVAILGVHRMKQKPVVRDGQIVVGDVMLLSLSFDHRVVDGHVGAAFAYDVIAMLEKPERLLLEPSA